MTRMEQARCRLGWLGAMAALGWPAAAPPLLGADAPAGRLEPIVVVGERASASVLLGSDLRLLQADSLADLSGAVPGFNVVTSDTRGYGDIISMRGSGNALFFSAPSVAMVMDDVPMGEVFSYPSGLLDLAQVRLLRGPQGAAFGRNGAAGLIEMTTPAPGGQYAGSLRLEGGSYDTFRAHLDSSGPLGATGLSHTLQLYHEERDGFINDPTLGRTIDDRSLTGGLANLYWKPSADTEWRLRVFAEQANDGAQRLSSLSSPDPFVTHSNLPGSNDMERLQVSLHWTKEAAWGRLKSITAWQEWKLDPSITDLDFMALGPVFDMSSTIYQEQRIWSQELRLESPEGAGPWSWRTGLFWMDQMLGGDATRVFPVPTVPVPMGPGDYMSFSERTLFDIDQANVAAYGRVSYALNQDTELQAGARLEYVSSRIDRSKTNSFFQTSVVRDDLSAWYGSPEIGLRQSLNDGVSWFARSAIGIKPAGFSAFASTPATARYDEETGWNNELGIEVALPDEHLELGLTGFCNWIHDYQLNRPDQWSTDYFTVNADRVTSLGLELQARWQPAEALTVHAAAGWVRAEFDDYFDPGLGVSRDGNTVPYIPEFSGSLALRYDLPKGFYAQTSLRVNGPTYYDDANSGTFRQDAYLVWDAEIGYAHGRFSIALFGRNLTDENYYTFINPQISAGAPGDPQVFGIRAAMTF